MNPKNNNNNFTIENNDPEFSFKSGEPFKNDNFKVPISTNVKIDIDKDSLFTNDNNESPKFNTDNKFFDNQSNSNFTNQNNTPLISNSSEIPQGGLDFESAVKHQIEKTSDKYFSNNQVYNNQEEIEYAKKSHLEYMKLLKENKDPLGVMISGGFKPYKLSEIKKHNKENDLWMVVNGEVFNMTMYLDYHPGGAKKLMLGAGRDATSLFNKYHPWVNYHNLAGKLKIGYLVDEDDSEK